MIWNQISLSVISSTFLIIILLLLYIVLRLIALYSKLNISWKQWIIKEGKNEIKNTDLIIESAVNRTIKEYIRLEHVKI